MSARTDALEILESRFTELAASPKPGLYGEVDMAIEMCHIFGALTCEERRHYVRRRNLIYERESEQLRQLMESRVRRQA